jgi:6,7-dimethyl-8-ribityllumazine synthase
MRGDTIHFDLIAGEVARGLGALGREGDVPVLFGVLTTDTLEQAIHRAGAKAGNKGAEVAQAAVLQVSLHRALSKPKARRKKG